MGHFQIYTIHISLEIQIQINKGDLPPSQHLALLLRVKKGGGPNRVST